MNVKVVLAAYWNDVKGNAKWEFTKWAAVLSLGIVAAGGVLLLRHFAEVTHGLSRSQQREILWTTIVLSTFLLAAIIVIIVLLYKLGMRSRARTSDATPIVGVNSTAERIFLDIDARMLVALKNGNHTLAEKQRLWKPYVGKWIRVSGPVVDVSETKLFLANYTTPTTGLYELILKFEPAWSDRISVLQKGSNVSVVGCIDDFKAVCVVLSRCELAEPDTHRELLAIQPRQLTATQKQLLRARLQPLNAQAAVAGYESGIQLFVYWTGAGDCADYAKQFEELFSDIGFSVPRMHGRFETFSEVDHDGYYYGVWVRWNSAREAESGLPPVGAALVDSLKAAGVDDVEAFDHRAALPLQLIVGTRRRRT
jgi:hypothetical protein